MIYMKNLVYNFKVNIFLKNKDKNEEYLYQGTCTIFDTGALSVYVFIF